MPLFVMLDVTWADNPKIIAAGLDGRGLHATVMCISKRLETDGWIDRSLLYREGADDALIDRLVELRLLDAEGRTVRPHDWLDRNPSQGAIDAKRSAKAEAARKGNHKRWGHPGGVADCPVCTIEPQVSRTSDPIGSHPVDGGSPYTESETESETTTPAPALRGTQVADLDPTDNDASGVERVVLDGDAREQAIRRTAALVGRVLAEQRGADDLAGYAASVCRRIVTTPTDIDHVRIERLLDAGQAPDAIAAGWDRGSFGADPLVGLGSRPQSPAPGPDALGHYAANEAARREQMAHQEAAPAAVVKSLAAESRRNLGKAVPA